MSPYLLSWLPLRYLTIFFIIKSHMIHLLWDHLRDIISYNDLTNLFYESSHVVSLKGLYVALAVGWTSIDIYLLLYTLYLWFDFSLWFELGFIQPLLLEPTEPPLRFIRSILFLAMKMVWPLDNETIHYFSTYKTFIMDMREDILTTPIPKILPFLALLKATLSASYFWRFMNIDFVLFMHREHPLSMNQLSSRPFPI